MTFRKITEQDAPAGWSFRSTAEAEDGILHIWINKNEPVETNHTPKVTEIMISIGEGADAGHLMVEEGEGGFLAVDHEGCLRFALPCAALGLPNAIFERKLPVWPHGNAVIFDLKPLAKTDKPGPRA